MFSKVASIFFGLVLLAFTMFVAGMWTVHKNWAPWRNSAEIRGAVKSLRNTGRLLPRDSFRPRRNYMPNRKYTVYDKAAVAPGMLAITRIDPDNGRYLIDLVGEDGAVLHSWPVEYSRIVEGARSDIFTHATKVLPDGSVLVSFDGGKALARLDACGDPLWARTDATYHHVIQSDIDSGGFWAWKSTTGTNSQNQIMFRFDEDTGEELEAIDLVDDVVLGHPENALATIIPEDFNFRREVTDKNAPDVFHPNDIEPLPEAMARAFPQFSAGDLLISLRNSDLVAVVDRKTYRILWSLRGPWLQQHDPDWQADGTITVFNNNTDRPKANIVRIDPKTNAAEIMFGTEGPAYTSYIMGRQERLPNGNWLITATIEGRVIEVASDGTTVREYSNIVNPEFNGIVPFAEYLPATYFTTFPTCVQ